MQGKQSGAAVAQISKSSNAEKPQTTALQQRLETVKTAINKQSSSTRMNLSGKFRVN